MSLNLKQGVIFTNLGRAFHPVYKQHRRVLWLMALAAIAASIAAYLRAEALLAILLAGLNAALAVFIAWALAREFDPDRETVSLLVPIWVIAAALIFGPLPLLPSAIFIGTSRFLIRIVGLAVKPIESLFIFLAPLALMLLYQNPAFGLLAALTFSFEAYFEKFPRKETLYALFAFGATLAFIIVTAALPTFTGPSARITAIVGLISILILIKLIRLKQPQSRSDFNEQPINQGRLRAKILLSLLIALLALHTGDSGFLLLVPLWAALLTAAI